MRPHAWLVLPQQQSAEMPPADFRSSIADQSVQSGCDPALQPAFFLLIHRVVSLFFSFFIYRRLDRRDIHHRGRSV
ncbi:MAG: hypothetical protein CSA21_00435 [Deltaproteobacteria bacterium]|nr:MAG: hypothetical protein CSA21_00435 [Deltaproteobacteria bacterium]